MNILFTINDAYAPHMASTIVSILLSQTENTKLKFYVISSDLSIDSQNNILKLKNIRDFSITFIDSQKGNFDFSLFPITIQHISLETYFRLFAHEFISDASKILHLDVDLLVLRDLSELWNTPLNNNYAVGIRCPAINGKHLKVTGFNPSKHMYSHAGVTILNLSKMREDKITRIIIETVEKYKSILRFQDQDILNIIFRGKTLEAPLSYNAVTSIFEDKNIISKLKQNDPSKYLETIKNPHIVHFSRKTKPWHSNCRHPYKNHYWKYLEKTPWQNIKPEKVPVKQRLFTYYSDLKVSILASNYALLLKKALTPLLDNYLMHLVKKGLKHNIEIKFSGPRKGLRLYSYIEPSDSLFFYFKQLTGCSLTSQINSADAALIWGTKFSFKKLSSLKHAIKHKLPLLIAEDGFIRSIDIAENGEAGLSCILDHRGIYYDSDLGNSFDYILQSEWTISNEDIAYSREVIEKIKNYHISKYNLAIPEKLNFDPEKKYDSIVLVLDQRKGDQSVSGANANSFTFKRMLKDAIKDNPRDLILIKTHPDEISGGVEGYFSKTTPKEERVKLLQDNFNPISLLEAVDKVYVVSSQMGFEALLCNKTVFCYGSPFYSGYGLTIDRATKTEPIKRRSLEEVFYVTYVMHTKYFNPDSNLECEALELVNYLHSKTFNR